MTSAIFVGGYGGRVCEWVYVCIYVCMCVSVASVIGAYVYVLQLLLEWHFYYLFWPEYYNDLDMNKSCPVWSLLLLLVNQNVYLDDIILHI